MNEKYRLILALAFSVEICLLGMLTAFRYVTKDNSFGFDIALMALGGGLAALIAGWKKDA